MSPENDGDTDTAKGKGNGAGNGRADDTHPAAGHGEAE